MADRKPLPTTSTYSSAFDLESTSDSVNTGSRPLLPSTEEFHVCEPQPPRSKAKALFQSAQRLAAESWHDAKKDCKSARWRRGGLWTLLILWGVGLVLALALLPLHAAASSHLACKPDHSFSVLNQYNAWNLGGFFQLTSPLFVDLTFSQAKLIDVIWDVGIGRLGQIVLVFFSWKAFALHIISEMEGADGRAVTYNTYWTFFMGRDAGAGLMTVLVLVRDFATRKGLRSKVTMVIVVLTMVFVMSWPTIAGAMTSYDNNTGSYVNRTDDTQVPFSAFQPLLYVIHDGSRINLTDDFKVVWCNGSYSGDPVAWSTARTGYDWCRNTQGGSHDSSNDGLQHNVSAYVETYGFYGLKSVESLWTYESNISLSSPILNISAYYVDQSSDYFGDSWVDNRTGMMPFSNWSNMAYVQDDSIYSLAYIQGGNGLCQPNGAYSWGFSFLQLFIALCLMAAWTLAIWVVWLRAHVRLSSRGAYHEIPNRYQSALVLSKAIAEGFAAHAPKPSAMSNKDFELHRSKTLKGGSVRHDTVRTFMGSKVGVWANTKKWLRREKWSCLALTILTAWVAAGWMVVGYAEQRISYYGYSPSEYRTFVAVEVFYMLSLWTVPSFLFAMLIGTTTKSRLFFMGVWAIPGIVVIIALFNM